VRVVGARTLVPPNAPELRPWRYVHVRRLVLMIEESIDQSTQWLVFEPNRPEKWREVDRVVRSFLDGQWRRGRLDGATADDAFGVTCDETSNPAPEVEAGRMTCVIALRPPEPSEFVIVRLGRRVGETGAVEFGGPAGG
jgi:phage tail sheath protein FI